MKNLTLYLKLPSGFKDNLPRSDTLFGAVCWGVRLFYGEKKGLTDFLATYQDKSPAMLLSSSFPFIEKDKKIIHFLPKPHSKPLKPQFEIEKYKSAQKFNKVKYVDSQLFQEIINNGYQNQDLWNKFQQGELFLSEDEKILSKMGKIPSLPTKAKTIPGNAIDRLKGGTMEGKLYHTTEWFFEEESGAFLLAKISEEWCQKVLTIFRYYGDKGLGGDSSVGKGNYTLQIEEGFPIQEANDGKRWLTLSLYYPEEDEWRYYQSNSEKAWYSVVKRKGKIESNFSPTVDIWKKSILMAEEGSSFPVIAGKPFYGTMPIVKEKSDSIKIFQYGIAFSVKIRGL